MDVSKDASSIERPRRIEILTGLERRRRWSPESKAQIVAESLAPGAVVAEVARRHDVRASQIQLWRKQARADVLAPLAGGGAFASVVVARPTPRPKPSAPSAVTVLEIEAGAVRVRVRAGADAFLVEAIVRALKTPA